MKEIEKSLQNFHQIKKTPPKFDNTESAPLSRPFARFEQIKMIKCIKLAKKFSNKDCTIPDS